MIFQKALKSKLSCNFNTDDGFASTTDTEWVVPAMMP
jgi:hypothetical protein